MSAGGRGAGMGAVILRHSQDFSQGPFVIGCAECGGSYRDDAEFTAHVAAALEAAGYGDMAEARAEAVEKTLLSLYQSFTDEDADIEIALMGGDVVRVRILDALDAARAEQQAHSGGTP